MFKLKYIKYDKNVDLLAHTNHLSTTNHVTVLNEDEDTTTSTVPLVTIATTTSTTVKERSDEMVQKHVTKRIEDKDTVYSATERSDDMTQNLAQGTRCTVSKGHPV